MKISTRGSWNISKNSRNLWNFQTWKFHPTLSSCSSLSCICYW